MEAFLVEAAPIAKEVIKENTGKNFFLELKMIRKMTSRLINKRIETRWSNLLDGIVWTPEENK